MLAASIISDGLLFVISLVIGILSLMGTLDLPSAASYAMIGLSGAIALSWIAMTAKLKGENVRYAESLLRKAISSKHFP